MERLNASPLFASELSGAREAARRAWEVPVGHAVDWAAGIVPRSIEDVRAAIADSESGRVYPLIRNTRDETVIGGDRADLLEVVGRLRCHWVELPAVSTVHCEIGRLVESDYRALHDIETVAPPGIAFYSGVSGRAIRRRLASQQPTRSRRRRSQPIDFPATIESAYADGIGLFIEVGAGEFVHAADRPHPRRSGRTSRSRPAGPIATRSPPCSRSWPPASPAAVPVDLARLYGDDAIEPPARAHRPRATIRVEIGPGEVRVPPLPSRRYEPAAAMVPIMSHSNGIHRVASRDPATRPPVATLTPAPDLSGLASRVAEAEQARIDAHRAFLRVWRKARPICIGRHIAHQHELLELANGAGIAVEPMTADSPSHGRPSRSCTTVASAWSWPSAPSPRCSDPSSPRSTGCRRGSACPTSR